MGETPQVIVYGTVIIGGGAIAAAEALLRQLAAVMPTLTGGDAA